MTTPMVTQDRTGTGQMGTIEALLRKKAQALFPDPNDQARFLALAFQESSFNPSAHNRKGEDSFGLFQFGPDMRRAYGMEIGAPAEAQVNAGGDYLSQLYKKHGGDWTKILAEHNLGLPRFQRMMRGEEDEAIRRFRASHLPAVERLASRFGAGTAPRTASSAPSPPGRAQAQPMNRVAASLPPEAARRAQPQVPGRSDPRMGLLLQAMRAAGQGVPPIIELMLRMKGA